MKIDDLTELLEDEDVLLVFMQNCNIIESKLRCGKCNIEFKLIKRGEKYSFRCNRCKDSKSALHGNNTLFRLSMLPYTKIMQIIFFFINDISLSKCSKMINVSIVSIQRIYGKCMNICYQECERNKRKIGGKGLSVEIDESVFSKRKYNKGRMTKQRWVVGGIVRETKEIFLVEVEKRDSATLSKVIEEYVEPQSRIITDKWKGYSKINKTDYHHLTVNHSLHFVDPQTGEHTNTIESVWGKVRT